MSGHEYAGVCAFGVEEIDDRESMIQGEIENVPTVRAGGGSCSKAWEVRRRMGKSASYILWIAYLRSGGC